MTSDKTAEPLLLAIETAGSACSVAVGRGSVVLAAEHQPMRYGHAEALLPMIDRVVAASGLARSALDGVAVSVGPGGFTGIRVGLGAAHGIALALKARLVGVTSFDAVAAILPAGNGAALIALDSRREDLYVQLLDRAPGRWLGAPATVLPDGLAEHVARLTEGRPLLVAGDMAEAAAAALGQRFAIEIAQNSAADARGTLIAAAQQIERESAERPVRPLYLRPPDVSFPKQRAPLSRVPR